MKSSDISIVIPALNEEKNLSGLLPFLKEAEGIREILVVDSPDSSDNTKNLCEKYGVKYLQVQKSGRAHQMNHGSQNSNANIVLFVHADVRPPDNFGEYIIETVESGNQAGFFSYKFSPSNLWLNINSKFTKKDGWFAGGGDQCQFYKKSTFEKLGGYDESCVIMEDFDLIRKVKRNKIPYTIIDKQAIVSSRKYKENSYLWVNLVNLIVFTAFHLGVSPIKLKKIYARALS